MDCIPYINDLKLEIEVLQILKENTNCNVEKINKQIESKQNLIQQCKNSLKKISINQIYYRLYLAMLEGLSPSKAVEKIAEENFLENIKPSSISSVWKYYNNLQKLLKQE